MIKALVKAIIPKQILFFLQSVRRLLSRLFYFGRRYRCPLCKSNLRTLLPYGLTFAVLREKNVVGGGFRQNARCPVCRCLDRERLLFLYLLHQTEVFRKPLKLLHVAPEGKLKAILTSKANLDYVTADLFAKQVMVEMDVTDIQYPDYSFDVIICNHVLEHIIDDRKAMIELCRVLKPDGWAILQVPISLSLDKTYEDFSITDWKGREQAFGQGDHVRIYAKNYEAKLAQAGFKVNVFNWKEAASFGGEKNIFGLNEDECLYLGYKL
jgi:SAM-dependent methyltransferase